MKRLTKYDIQHYFNNLFQKENRFLFDNYEAEYIWRDPFIRVASARDPLFCRLKEIIGPFHWTPDEVLQKVNPGAEARSVIVWSLPASESARNSNKKEKYYPSREWAYTRTFGEMVNDALRFDLVDYLREQGFSAVAPHIHPENEMKHRDGPGWSCCWYERHAAFIAGTGTFGLSGGLITEQGIAHRLGSVITDLLLEPDPRPYGDNPFGWCLRTAEGTCGVCITRCPVGSIGESPEERDKNLCAQHDFETIQAYGKEAFGWDGEYGCGLCQTNVPCEFQKPKNL